MKNKFCLFLCFCAAIVLLNILFGEYFPTLADARKDTKDTPKEQNSTNIFSKLTDIRHKEPEISFHLYTKDRTKVDLFTDWLHGSHVICDNMDHVSNGMNHSLASSLTGFPGFIQMRNVLVDASRFLQKVPDCLKDRIECWGLRPGFFTVRFLFYFPCLVTTT